MNPEDLRSFASDGQRLEESFLALLKWLRQHKLDIDDSCYLCAIVAGYGLGLRSDDADEVIAGAKLLGKIMHETGLDSLASRSDDDGE